MAHRLQIPAGMRRSYESTVLPLRAELLAAAQRLTRSRSDAEDLLQDTLLRGWTFWDRFEPGTNARAWMHRILMHTFINEYRRSARQKKLLERLSTDPFLSSDLNRDPAPPSHPPISAKVRSAIDSLSEPFRTVLVHVDVHDASYEETAAALGCPIGTVMSRLHRARKIVKAALADHATSEGILATPQAA